MSTPTRRIIERIRKRFNAVYSDGMTAYELADALEDIFTEVLARSHPAEAAAEAHERSAGAAPIDAIAAIEAIDHPCHDVCIGILHADCQCAAWIRQEAISAIKTSAGAAPIDVERAIASVNASRQTHVHWAEWRRRGNVGDEAAGDLAHHEQAIRDYDHVLSVLVRPSEGSTDHG